MVNNKLQILLREALKGVNYEKIVLFGSRARGDFSEKSDYDILLIVGRNISIYEKMRLSTSLKKNLAEEGIDADVIIKSKEEVEYYKDRIGNVVRNALKEGVAL